jgi:hypothetical protein
MTKMNEALLDLVTLHPSIFHFPLVLLETSTTCLDFLVRNRGNGVCQDRTCKWIGDFSPFNDLTLLNTSAAFSVLFHCRFRQRDGDRASKFEGMGLTE